MRTSAPDRGHVLLRVSSVSVCDTRLLTTITRAVPHRQPSPSTTTTTSSPWMISIVDVIGVTSQLAPAMFWPSGMWAADRCCCCSCSCPCSSRCCCCCCCGLCQLFALTSLTLIRSLLRLFSIHSSTLIRTSYHVFIK